MANESLERRPARLEVIPLSEEIRHILETPELWDDDSNLGDPYKRRRWDHAWKAFCASKKLDVYAGSVVSLITIVVVATTWASVFWSILAGIGGLIGTLLVILLFFWLLAPSEMDTELSGKLKNKTIQLSDNRRQLQRVASIAIRDHERYIDSLKADLRGRATQVYIEDMTLDEESICFFVTLQLDLWNLRDNAAIIQNLSLVVQSSFGTLQGKWVSLYGITYTKTAPEFSFPEPQPIELDEHELPKNPLPDGYVRGRPQPEKWLRFRFEGASFDDQISFGTRLQDYVTALDLLILDGDGELHTIPFRPPWVQHGTIENTFGSQRIGDDLAHALFAETYNALSRELQKCREGRDPDSRHVELLIRTTTVTLRKWGGMGYETEFNQCPDRASEEMNNWKPECKKAGMFLNARIEKLAEYMKEIRARH